MATTATGQNSILITEAEAAKMLNLSERMLGRLRNQNAIPYVSIGRAIRYRRDALEQWAIQQERPAAEGGDN